MSYFFLPTIVFAWALRHVDPTPWDWLRYSNREICSKGYLTPILTNTLINLSYILWWNGAIQAHFYQHFFIHIIDITLSRIHLCLHNKIRHTLLCGVTSKVDGIHSPIRWPWWRWASAGFVQPPPWSLACGSATIPSLLSAVLSFWAWSSTHICTPAFASPP